MAEAAVPAGVAASVAELPEGAPLAVAVAADRMAASAAEVQVPAVVTSAVADPVSAEVLAAAPRACAAMAAHDSTADRAWDQAHAHEAAPASIAARTVGSAAHRSRGSANAALGGTAVRRASTAEIDVRHDWTKGIVETAGVRTGAAAEASGGPATGGAASGSLRASTMPNANG